MKKVLSIILAITVVFSMCIPAFAKVSEEHSADSCSTYPVIIVRGMDFGGLTVDYGTENAVPAINADVPEIIGSVFKAIFKGIFTLNLDNTVNVVLDCAYEIFKYMSMDNNGESVYNIGQPKYPESAENYEDLIMSRIFYCGIYKRIYFIRDNKRIKTPIIIKIICMSVRKLFNAGSHHSELAPAAVKKVLIIF